YRVERELGSGGMGVVVEATHVALDQRVAIKLLNPELVRMPEIVGRFLREARIAATLPGEHIARATDVGQTEAGVPYLVMELLTGHDFAVEIERAGRFDVARAVTLVLEACEGVADAHAVGLVHRDLKPANLFLAHRAGRPPVVKVLDFGLSKAPKHEESVSLTQDGAIFGTPQYMSPEQVFSTRDVDARSDQHALAMILFEALTGRTPYEGTTVNQLIVAIATAQPPRLRELRKDVPAGLDEAVACALAKKPADRFPTLAGFARAIAPFGGPAAQESARNIERILRGGQAPFAASASASVSEHARTMPILAPRQPARSEADLTSSLDPTRLARRSRRRWIAVALVAPIAALALFFLSIHRRAIPGASTTAIEGSVAVIPASATPPPPADSSAVTVSVALPASATAPLPSASAPAVKRLNPVGPHVTSPAPAVKRAIGVFGERNK
ncbi:MAG: serine/threonine-protein kinase, partial [Byssovorax sp.]